MSDARYKTYGWRDALLLFVRQHIFRLPSDHQWIVVKTTIPANLLRDSLDTAILVAQRDLDQVLRLFAEDAKYD